MIKSEFQSLDEIATSMNLKIREPTDYELDLYVTIPSEKIIEVIKELKVKYNVSHLLTIIVQDLEDEYKLLYPFSINLSG